MNLSPAIEMRGITKRFAGVVANDNVDFDARFGEVHALIGENGAGKSTLMSVLAGLYRPDSGSLAINGRQVALRSPRDAIAHGVGMVYQHFMLVETFTVAENALLGLEGQGVKLETARIEAELARLSDEHGLEVDPRARIWQLSVGEQQRVEILRLLFRGAKILVFDEPTAVLTPQEADRLIQTLRGMAASGFCVVFISHKLDEVRAVADRVTVMAKGKVVATVPVSTDRHALARMMVGRELASFIEHPTMENPIEHRPGAVALELRGLRAMSDMRLPALHGIDLAVRSGEVIGVAGVAGNGQRELAEVISGLRAATAGEVRVDGRDLTNATPAAVARAGVAHVPEDRLATGLIGGLGVSDNAILRDFASPSLSRGPFLRASAIATFTDAIVRDYDVKTPTIQTVVSTLSGGNQQKLLLGRELSGEPKVLIAVHPTRGVDIGATETIHGLIQEQRARGAAVLLISEDLDELLALSDRIAVMYEGRIMGTVDAAEADVGAIGLLMAGVAPESGVAGRNGAQSGG